MEPITRERASYIYDCLLDGIADERASIDGYCAAGMAVPDYVQETFDCLCTQAGSFASRWGFDFDASDYVA